MSKLKELVEVVSFLTDSHLEVENPTPDTEVSYGVSAEPPISIEAAQNSSDEAKLRVSGEGND